MAEEIVNRVQRSGILTIDFEEWYPEEERISFDMAPLLWQGMVLKEKDFRTFIEEHNWETYQDKLVAIHCSADAIIPTWAYMLLTTALTPFAKKVFLGSIEQMEQSIYQDLIEELDVEAYQDRRIVIKGCSEKPISLQAYVALTAKLKPVAKAIMFGEPCSTVPIYRKPRK